MRNSSQHLSRSGAMDGIFLDRGEMKSVGMGYVISFSCIKLFAEAVPRDFCK